MNTGDLDWGKIMQPLGFIIILLIDTHKIDSQVYPSFVLMPPPQLFFFFFLPGLVIACPPGCETLVSMCPQQLCLADEQRLLGGSVLLPSSHGATPWTAS